LGGWLLARRICAASKIGSSSWAQNEVDQVKEEKEE
jgi:hypothetical protein